MKNFEKNSASNPFSIADVGGFTLIELLMVVAIIGMLTSVVLWYLGPARAKGNDAAIKTNLNNIKGAAELYYLNPLTTSPIKSAYSYGDESFGNCPTSASTTSMFSRDATILNMITEATKRSSASYALCAVRANSWAIAVILKTDNKSVWCVDSSNASKQITHTSSNISVSDVINNTTYLCK